MERWGIAGLLHDLDYERHPDAATHGAIGADEMARRGYPAEVIDAVRRHNDALGIARTTRLDHLVYACDELSGFLVAVALMRPTRKLADVEPANVRKRMKDKAFARAVPREMLLAGADELGLDFDDHVANMVRFLTAVAPRSACSGDPHLGQEPRRARRVVGQDQASRGAGQRHVGQPSLLLHGPMRIAGVHQGASIREPDPPPCRAPRRSATPRPLAPCTVASSTCASGPTQRLQPRERRVVLRLQEPIEPCDADRPIDAARRARHGRHPPGRRWHRRGAVPRAQGQQSSEGQRRCRQAPGGGHQRAWTGSAWTAAGTAVV